MLGKSHLIVSEAIIVGVCLAVPEAVIETNVKAMQLSGNRRFKYKISNKERNRYILFDNAENAARFLRYSI